MEYADINDVITADGLRLVIVQGVPSPWSQAAKAMMEYKGLQFVVGPQQPMAPNAELQAWSGVNNAPVVAWNDEPPVNRWNDILFLLERLAPEKPLIPEEPEARVRMFGLAHEICGELGFGWNCRLNMMRPKPGEPPSPFAVKYGHNDADAARASSRVIAFLRHMTGLLQAQSDRGSEHLIGDALTAVDFYWAAFCTLIALPPPEVCPVHPAIRPMFEQVPAEVTAAIDPILLAHRDRTLQAHFRIPMEL